MPGAPLIGLTTSLPTTDLSAKLADRIQAYVRSVELAGGLPLIVPYGLPPATLRQLYGRLDGLLLTGGGDLSPERYGRTAVTELRSLDPERDETELQLARWAADDPKPLLAICRGLQVINVAAGGTLFQDLPSQRPGPIRHDPEGQPSEQPVHAVSIAEDSLLAARVEAPIVQVNSAHHQAIEQPGSGLRPIAFAPDGVIEAAELEGHPYYLGVQWHPERMPARPESAALFQGLIAAARSRPG
ncbi:MAG: gamma-glutamyl-gamma-aminobutyrate hydrolase family protein [Anaerolineales bacterium]|nr:gamma-glutamyl-gamma-aminobutyrate hydrolase family protein [Anaerolineales bacterium]